MSKVKDCFEISIKQFDERPKGAKVMTIQSKEAEEWVRKINELLEIRADECFN